MIYNEVINALKKHNDDSMINLIAIATTHHYGMEGKHMVAFTTKYRRDTGQVNGFGEFIVPGSKNDIALTAIDEYGDLIKCHNGYPSTRHRINIESSEPSKSNEATAYVRDETVYLVSAKNQDHDTPIQLRAFDSYPLYPTGEIPNATYKTKPGCSLVVLDYESKGLNKLIQKKADDTLTDSIGFYSIPGKFGPIPQQSYNIWSLLSELYGCMTYNEIYEKEGIEQLMVPVDMRGEGKYRKIGDMAKHKAVKDDGSPVWTKKDGKWVKCKLAVHRQKCGADATIHQKGCSRLAKSLFPELDFIDFKVDHYAAHSKQISIETYTYNPEEGWKEYGWLWKRNKGGYTAYIVDDLIYLFKTSKLRAYIEAYGKPEFEEIEVSLNNKFMKVKGNYHVNTADNNDARTGMGKYGFFISLEDAAGLAERIDPILHAYVHDVERRSEEYRKLDKGMSEGKRGWLNRMVCKSEEFRQRGA
ncbi:MAG: hypothetical protein ACRCZ2_04150 [Fusobacteriaceae bacterium]